MPNKQRLVDSEFTRQQYTVHKIFYVRTLKISQNIDEVQILIISFHFRPPIIKKVEQLQRLFFGSVADGPA